MENDMNALQLSGGAEAFARAMDLRIDDQRNIRNCIGKYAKPDTFCKTLSWIAYRVGQACLFIFDRSDWQAAQRLIQRHLMLPLLLQGIVKEKPENRLEQKIANQAENSAKQMAKIFLSNTLKMYEQQINLTNQAQAEIQALYDPEDFTKRITDLIRRVEARIAVPNQA